MMAAVCDGAIYVSSEHSEPEQRITSNEKRIYLNCLTELLFRAGAHQNKQLCR